MSANTPWTIFQKIGFRFFFIYTLLFTSPFPLNIFDFLSNIINKIDEFIWLNLVPYIGENILNVFIDSSGSYRFTGSGDTTYNYVQIFCYFLIAVLGTLIWSLIDRNRKNYVKLLRILVVFLAYFLIFSMFSYGFYKIIPLQFPVPSLGRLVQSYGDSSPMGIAWTFMGASKAYTMFSGFAEVLAGLLLIFRRTRTLGGLVCFGVMMNIFAMNMCYDIPVKLFSFHLLLFALFVFMQDWKRIFAVFFTKAATIPRSFPQYFKKRSFNIIATILKVYIVSWFFYVCISQAMSANESYGPNAPKPYMHGIYDITHIEKNKDTIPLLITDDTLWKRFIIQRESYIYAYQMNGDRVNFKLEFDTIQKSMYMKKRSDSTDTYDFTYTLKDSILTLKGTHLNDTILIKAKQFDLKKFKLINRGFHWINETPYNR
ncbi:hypothetical protein H2O64_00770 [Kordia sp. YSTF-M3]|uniref:DoxX family protein n=1 Tax=Kordia aestuariivivens TaxID=2759037 RepID=A0ABR7Q3Q2_9FLAO|nr:hypothetical protein [Kordia aestuariivivens]MBC8753181.1 hypothetical protein [Kordia aestuariivivens]